MRDTTVLLLDADAKAAPTIVRALGRSGVRVLVAGPTPGPSPAQRSRYSAARLKHPHAILDPTGLVDWLASTIQERGVDCVLPMTDYTIRVLDRARDRLAGRAVLAMPASGPLAVAFDKARTLRLAGSLGIAAPRTWEPSSVDQVAALADDLPFPVYVKSRESYASSRSRPRFARGRYAHDKASLVALWRELDELSAAPLIQEHVPGHLHKVDAVYQQGRCVDLFCQEVIRTWPISGGYGVMRRSVAPSDAPAEEAKRLMAALAWTGPAEVEFIVDPRDGRARLMEVNGRFWASVEFAHLCGVPIGPDTVRVALGLPTVGPGPYKVGARMRWLEGDLKRLHASLFWRGHLSTEVFEVPGRLEALGDVLSGFALGIHQDDFYLDDPLPALALAWRTLWLARHHTDPGAAKV